MGKASVNFEYATIVARNIVDNIEKVIVGKRKIIEWCVACVLSGGHVLIQDVPGVGKTMLARSIALSVDCSFSRIQFTPDLLPSDITGTSFYNQATGLFEYRPGPILAQVVLADEINRATPKTQSALLECMEEHQVTVDGAIHPTPKPFVVIATQNPGEYHGTFPLPETQLDRFLMRVTLGYPSFQEEMSIIESQQLVHPIENLATAATLEDILLAQDITRQVYVDPQISQYVIALSEATRSHPDIALGASPRASIAMVRTSQALALIRGREFVLPDDVKEVAPSVLIHRIIPGPSARISQQGSDRIVTEILDSVPVPGNRFRIRSEYR